MHVAHLSLADFRSYPLLDLPIEEGVTAFVGPNAQGKTNLIEAVGYLATLGSHRVAGDAPLVRTGAQRAIVRGRVVRDDREQLVELEINPGRANRARINRSAHARPRDVLGILRAVLFAPEDLALAKGDPGERRRFLDDLVVARSPRMAGVRQDYDRVLKQRNTLLKTAALARRAGGGSSRPGGADLSTLDVWDQHLATTGAELLAARRRLIAALRPLVDKAYEQVAPGGGPTSLEYRCSAGEEILAADGRDELVGCFLDALGRTRKQEIERGITLVGPHRDDLLLGLGDRPAKGYASHGESWSYALALRLASYELLRAEGGAGGEPVLILDDVFAELDSARRRRLAELVAPGEQVLVTAAVPEDIPPVLTGTRYAVTNATVVRS